MNIISVIVILIIFAVACFGFFVLGVGVGGALEECKRNRKILKQFDTCYYTTNESEAAQNGKDT